MADLSNIRVAVIATDGFEESELAEPVKALREAGAKVDVVAPKKDQIQGYHHGEKSSSVWVDRSLDEIQPDEYDAVMLPGGALNADHIRMHPKLQSFLRELNRERKPIAAICHAPWELESAGLVHGRRMTSYHTIQDDLRNAGADWVDEEVVVDDNWVTSRKPSDIPAFNREMLKLFSRVPADVTI